MNKHSPTGKRRLRASHAQPSERLFHTPDEFARRASISRATVWRLMRDGRLRYARFGRARRIPVSEYERLATEPLDRRPEKLDGSPSDFHKNFATRRGARVAP